MRKQTEGWKKSFSSTCNDADEVIHQIITYYSHNK